MERDRRNHRQANKPVYSYEILMKGSEKVLDDLGELIDKTLTENVNSTRVFLDQGTLFIYSERTGDATDLKIPNKDRKKWQSAWDSRRKSGKIFGSFAE